MLSNISPKWALYLSLLASSAVADFTWWVDSTCDSRFDPGKFDLLMAEAFQTAGMAWGRVSRTKEEEPQAHEAFKTLFYYDAGSTQMEYKEFWDHFSTITTDLPKFTKEPLTGDAGRKASEIRIYCDNDERMKLVDDDKTIYPNMPADTPLNSKREEKKQEWEDKINKVRKLGMPACKRNDVRTDGKFAAAAVYGMRVRTGNEPGEHGSRVSITICNKWLDMPGRVDTWDDIGKGKDFPDLTGVTAVDAMNYLGSQIMYHELMHHSRFTREDHAYGIQKAVLFPNPKTASENADTHAIFGALMRALQYGYKLESAVDGTLEPDDTIPNSFTATTKRRSTRINCDDGGVHSEAKKLVCREFAG